MNTRMLMVFAFATTAFIDSGCEVQKENFRGVPEVTESPTSVPTIEPSALIIELPDYYGSIAFVCVGPNGVYSTYRDNDIEVVPNDPICKGK